MSYLPIRVAVVAAIFAAAASAQEVEIPVQSLLRVPASGREATGDAFVTRAFARDVDEAEASSWHRIAGERSLLHLTDDESVDECEPQGIFTEDSLTEAIRALGNLDAGSLSFLDDGTWCLVQSQIPERIRVAMDAIRRSLPPRIRLSVQLERIDGDHAELLLAGTRVFRNGETAVVGTATSQRVVLDFDVEIAGSSEIATPITRDVRSGATIAVRARPLILRDEAIVEAVIRTATPLDSEPIEVHDSIGPLDRTVSDIAECGLSFRIARGPESVHEWTTHDGRQLRLTCRADWDVKPLPPGDVLVLCSSLMGAPVLGFPYLRRSAEDVEPFEATPVYQLVEQRTSDDADGLVLFEGGNESGGGCLIVEGDPGHALADRLARTIDGTLTSAHVELEVVDVPRDVPIDVAGALPPDARVIARSLGPVLVEHSTSFGALIETSYVAAWGVEVAEAARIPDPYPGMVEDGYFATIRPKVAVTGIVESVALTIDIQRLLGMEPRNMVLNAPRPVPKRDPSEAPQSDSWLRRDVILVERPKVTAQRFCDELPLDRDGRAMSRSAADALFGAGRDLLVRVRVR